MYLNCSALVCAHVSIFNHVSLPVSGRGDEVYAAVDSGVRNPFLPVDVYLLLQVRLVLVINKLHDGLPARPWQEWIEGMMEEDRKGKRWTEKRKGERNKEVETKRRGRWVKGGSSSGRE